MRRFYVLFFSAFLFFGSCLSMQGQLSSEEVKLKQIYKMNTDYALGRCGGESELFRLCREFKDKKDKKFESVKLIYVELVFSGYRGDVVSDLSEAVDIFIDLARNMPSKTFFNPLNSSRIIWKECDAGLLGTLSNEVRAFRRAVLKNAPTATSMEERLKGHLLGVFSGTIASEEELSNEI
jgi:hypothetical protein